MNKFIVLQNHCLDIWEYKKRYLQSGIWWSTTSTINIGGKSKIPNPQNKFFLTDVKAFSPKVCVVKHIAEDQGFIIKKDLSLLNVCDNTLAIDGFQTILLL